MVQLYKSYIKLDVFVPGLQECVVRVSNSPRQNTTYIFLIDHAVLARIEHCGK